MNDHEFRTPGPDLRPAVAGTLTSDTDWIAREFSNRDVQKRLKIPMSDFQMTFTAGELEFFSPGRTGDSATLLVRGANHEHFFAVRGTPITDRFGRAFHTVATNDGSPWSLFPCNYDSTRAFVDETQPGIHSVRLGNTPRIGIGSRMTTYSWAPSIRVLNRRNLHANLIQNSVREVRVLNEIERGEAARDVYLYSFGTIKEGHTGSTFEGLWLRGTVEAFIHNAAVPYGSDADHIKVEDWDAGLERARGTIDACRNYSFFTIDTSALIDFSFDRDGDSRYAAAIGESVDSLVSFHCDCDNGERRLGRAFVAQMLKKYGESFYVLEQLDAYLANVRGVGTYDLEWSVDEIPAEFSVRENITTPEEILFVLRELRRRGVGVTHIAPNWGVEKGRDYAMPGGLDFLSGRLQEIGAVAEAFGVTIDVHSGDDLSSKTRRVIHAATGGNVHFKISPVSQELFAEVVFELAPEAFQTWWDHSVAFAREQAREGSRFAAECVELASTDRSPHSSIFHHYCYPPVGIPDSDGTYQLREVLYGLPDNVYTEYGRRWEAYLDPLVSDLFETEAP